MLSYYAPGSAIHGDARLGLLCLQFLFDSPCCIIHSPSSHDENGYRRPDICHLSRRIDKLLSLESEHPYWLQLQHTSKARNFQWQCRWHWNRRCHHRRADCVHCSACHLPPKASLCPDPPPPAGLPRPGQTRLRSCRRRAGPPRSRQQRRSPLAPASRGQRPSRRNLEDSRWNQGPRPESLPRCACPRCRSQRRGSLRACSRVPAFGGLSQRAPTGPSKPPLDHPAGPGTSDTGEMCSPRRREAILPPDRGVHPRRVPEHEL